MQNVFVNDEQVAAIAAHMKGYFDKWLAEAQGGLAEEVRRQGESIEKLIRSMEKRSDELRADMNARSAELRADMNARSAELRGEMDAHFALAEKRYGLAEKRIELVEKRIDELRSDMNTGFKQLLVFVTAAFVVLGLPVTVFGLGGTLG